MVIVCMIFFSKRIVNVVKFLLCVCYLILYRSSVRVGEYDTSSDPDCASTGFCAPRSVNHAISHVIVHPDYKQGQYHHDIALLVLKTPLNYSGKCSKCYY